MKKLLKSLIVLTVMFSFIGCAGFQTKQEVLPGNVFIDSWSNTTLKIADEFEYKGLTAFKKGHLTPSNTDGSLNLDSNYHIWVNGEKTSYILVLFKTLTDDYAYWCRIVPNKKWKVFKIKKEE